MEINKNDFVRVGGDSAVTASGLPMYRRFKSFEANRESESIVVWFEQWLESPTGEKLELVTKNYIAKNSAEVYYIVPEKGHIVPATGHDDAITGEYVVDVPEHYVVDKAEQKIITQPKKEDFNNWYFYPIAGQMAGMTIGKDLIVGSINNNLKNLPF